MGRPRADGSPTKKKKKARNPNHPKRAITAYFFYLSAFREERKKKGLSIRPGDIAKEAGINWTTVLTEEEKCPHLQKAAEDRARYDNEMAVFDSKYKKYKDPNKPKKPATAFFLFLADFRVKMQGKGLAHKDINCKAGVEWGTMSETDKEPYKADNGKLRTKYEAAMAKYNEEQQASKNVKSSACVDEEEDIEDGEDVIEDDEEEEDDDDE